MEKVGTENLEKCLDLASKNIVLGLKIAKDGVNESDLMYLPEAFENVKELVAFVASKPQIADEVKDLDVAEGIALLKKAYDEYKEVKGEVSGGSVA